MVRSTIDIDIDSTGERAILVRHSLYKDFLASERDGHPRVTLRACDCT